MMATRLRTHGHEVKIEGVDARVHLNRLYLLKALRFPDEPAGIIDATSPTRVSREGRQMIIMPVRTEGPPVPETSADAGRRAKRRNSGDP